MDPEIVIKTASETPPAPVATQTDVTLAAATALASQAVALGTEIAAATEAETGALEISLASIDAKQNRIIDTLGAIGFDVSEIRRRLETVESIVEEVEDEVEEATGEIAAEAIAAIPTETPPAVEVTIPIEPEKRSEKKSRRWI